MQRYNVKDTNLLCKSFEGYLYIIPLHSLIFKLIMKQDYKIEIIDEVVFYAPTPKRSKVPNARRKKVTSAIHRKINLSIQIVDRIHTILTSKGLKQKDLADLLGKKEAEISKWMRGTHNFTIETLASIEEVLGEPVLVAYTSTMID